jgi:hypothetical protein
VIVSLVVLGVFTTADRRSATIWAVTAAVVLGLLAANSMAPRAVRVTAVAVLALAALELGAMSLHSIPQQSRIDGSFTSFRTPTTDFLAGVDAGFTVALTDDGRPAEYQVPGMRPNANVLNQVASIDGYDGGVQITERWADALRRFQPDPPTELPLRNSLDAADRTRAARPTRRALHPARPRPPTGRLHPGLDGAGGVRSVVRGVGEPRMAR